MAQPVTSTVNGSASDPNEIVVAKSVARIAWKVTAGSIYFTVGAFGTAASGEGNTRIGSAATRGTADTGDTGLWEVVSFFGTAGTAASGAQSIYVRSQAAGTATLEYYVVTTVER